MTFTLKFLCNLYYNCYSTTIVLRKERKKDYSLPGSYRPIALENTLAKVVEKVLADCIRDAAEANGLLPWN
jgi:hypothetical protein